MATPIWQLSDWDLHILLDAARLQLQLAERRVTLVEARLTGVNLRISEQVNNVDRTLYNRLVKRQRELIDVLNSSARTVALQSQLTRDLAQESARRDPPRLTRAERDSFLLHGEGFWADKAGRINGK